jgi:hypothetical protein
MARGLSTKVQSLLKTQARAAAELRHDINELEAEIVTAENKLAAARSAPVPADIISERVDRYLAACEADARASFSPASAALPDGRVDSINLGAILNARNIVGGLVILGFGDTLRQRLIAEIAGSLKTPAMPEAERITEIKRLEDEIAHLHRVAERIRRDAERAGINIPVSDRADPAALLASDNDL